MCSLMSVLMWDEHPRYWSWTHLLLLPRNAVCAYLHVQGYYVYNVTFTAAECTVDRLVTSMDLADFICKQ